MNATTAMFRPKDMERNIQMRFKLVAQWIIIVFFVMALIGPAGYGEMGKKEFSIAVFPCTDVTSSFKKFHPLITYLNAETGLAIKLIFHQDFESYERAIQNGSLDFALQDPHVYVKLSNHYDRHNILKVLTREGKSIQSGVVIVRKDSGIKSLNGLRGKTVMFGPRVSSAKWIAAKNLFKEHNIDITTDLKGFSHGGCCEDIAFNVYLKAVDAGVVCDHFLTGHSIKQKELGVEAGQLAIIGTTAPVPTKIFSARKEVLQADVAKIFMALLKLDRNLPSHETILKNAEIGGFRRTKDQELNPIRKLMQTVNME